MNDTDFDPIELARAVEKSEEGLSGIASILGSFFKQLLAEEFTREEAFSIVMAWLMDNMQRGRE